MVFKSLDLQQAEHQIELRKQLAIETNQEKIRKIKKELQRIDSYFFEKAERESEKERHKRYSYKVPIKYGWITKIRKGYWTR